ncbi:cytoplasmic protein [Escherichia coli]|nr:cytoplasmic protein [Escherichia coli]
MFHDYHPAKARQACVLERIRDIHASMRRVYLQVICPPADSQPTVSPLR